MKYKVLYICRPELFDEYAPIYREHSARNTDLVESLGVDDCGMFIEDENGMQYKADEFFNTLDNTVLTFETVEIDSKSPLVRHPGQL